ncbi:MAG: hypothetical protein LBD59_10390, partial [Prevotellaceae bacterium]|nr:hypothetical protein [Prevotellaceae bacterium]
VRTRFYLVRRYPRRLCLHLHLCWQAQPAKINRTRHSLVRTRDTCRDGARPVPTTKKRWRAISFAETHAVRLYIVANNTPQ